jgi:hypothetical protein
MVKTMHQGEQRNEQHTESVMEMVARGVTPLLGKVGVEVLLAEDVLQRSVRIENVDVRLGVGGVSEDASEDLQDGSDACKRERQQKR